MKTDTITDADAQGLASPDDRMLTKVYLALAPVMQTYAVRRGSPEADDVVQEAFVKFVISVRAGRFHARTAGDVVAYLKTLVRHRIVDDFRRAQARCQDMMVELDEFAVPVSPTVYHDLDAQDADGIHQRSQQRALAAWKCSDMTKAVFVACVIDGRDIADVADQFGVSCGLVRQIRHRGLKRVRALAAAAA